MSKNPTTRGTEDARQGRPMEKPNPSGPYQEKEKYQAAYDAEKKRMEELARNNKK
ncbi:hypothetical protein K9U40_13750 [Xanthobacter autotrophicus]|uniref:hypothetical protein n=1 Tax=Xanthobacter TaxID=279 RepID=UPI0024AC77B4|nr:hypothetical protein [Xanthobacter autotrophicus]MDI4665384.1 hypothetical protein [Xanthobacter autotrophicus]